jgi:hypothetical protein
MGLVDCWSGVRGVCLLARPINYRNYRYLFQTLISSRCRINCNLRVNLLFQYVRRIAMVFAVLEIASAALQKKLFHTWRSIWLI